MPKPIRTGDFWEGPLEAETYIGAVHLNPRREDEGAMTYIVRISDLVKAGAAMDRKHDAKMLAAGDRE
jgi:hypothetical protein